MKNQQPSSIGTQYHIDARSVLIHDQYSSSIGTQCHICTQSVLIHDQQPSSIGTQYHIDARSALTFPSIHKTLRLLFLSLIFLSSVTLSAQDLELAGLWQGTLTIGSSMQGYRMEMYLEKSRKRVTGRIYIHISENKIVETKIKGVLYKDNSIYLDEISFVDNEKDDYIPPFLRKLELQWIRSIAGSSLNGYWQENCIDVFKESRQRGQIFLRKVLNNKA